MSGDFADVYDKQVWHVYGFFAYRVRGKRNAEDLTQQTFERALRAWSRFDPKRSAKPRPAAPDDPPEPVMSG
jgi:DNA-directed RNA polymerase specialized sigma24 family protein